MKLKGKWPLLVALALSGCGERETTTPSVERSAPSPLEQVDELLAGVDGGRLAPAVPEDSEAPATEVGPESVEIPVAKPVPDKPGFVVSPFNGKWIDVTGLPAGEIVADPEFPAEDKKYFKVPEFPPVPPVDPAPAESPGEEPRPTLVRRR